MNNSRRPKLHIWLYNHPFFYVSDQVDFLISVFRQHGYDISVGKRPNNSRLNILIESFAKENREILVEYCERTGKRLAVVMTEHLDVENGCFRFHGHSIWKHNDYMHPDVQVSRVRGLIESIPYIRAFLILGDLPKLDNFDTAFPGIDIRRLPFPKIEEIILSGVIEEDLTSDFLFTGAPTSFRMKILSNLKANGFAVNSIVKTVSRCRRNKLNRSSRIILNIPQRLEWKWISSMRVLASLYCGRPIVSLATRDDSMVSSSILQIDMKNQIWVDCLRERLHEWQDLYRTEIGSYCEKIDAFEKENPFPHDLLDVWMITERVGHSCENRSLVC